MTTYTSRSHSMQMPNHFVPLATEEMMYIEGGGSNDRDKAKRQAALRAEWAKLNADQKKQLQKDAAVCTAGMVLTALSAFGVGLSLSTAVVTEVVAEYQLTLAVGSVGTVGGFFGWLLSI